MLALQDLGYLLIIFEEVSPHRSVSAILVNVYADLGMQTLLLHGNLLRIIIASKILERNHITLVQRARELN